VVPAGTWTDGELEAGELDAGELDAAKAGALMAGTTTRAVAIVRAAMFLSATIQGRRYIKGHLSDYSREAAWFGGKRHGSVESGTF
jgi:hypothetical protein